MKFDGGAFFGVVPKVLWSRQIPADRRNRVTVGVNCLLIQAGGKTILVDTGLGTKHDRKWKTMYGLQTGRLLEQLRQRGVAPEAVDLVLLSHLHFDHAGGCTRKDSSGKIVPTFPRAKYLVQRSDWEEATHPNERNRAGYFSRDFVPVEEHKQLELLDGDEEVMPHVWVKRTGGHTKGHQMVMLKVGEQRMACLFDLVPTPVHLPLPWIASFDLFPVEVLDLKRTLLAQAEQERWLLLFDHGLTERAGYLERSGASYRLKPLEL
jgi:glyoxylase-like metal-dependent hydrolase (beta-lactamase superfamily II)